MSRRRKGGPPLSWTSVARGLGKCPTLATMGIVWAVVASQTGCVSTVGQPSAIAFVEPPRAELEASLAKERIDANEVLQLRLADGTTASVVQTYYVSADGNIEIAGHGTVQVAGKTLREAQQVVQAAVAVSEATTQTVELMLSEYYLVVVDENGAKRLTRVPIKGEVRVKDALASVPAVRNKIVWIARPDLSRYLSEQILPVDWETISGDANAPGNHKLKPGDWLFVAEEPAKGMARVFNSVSAMLSSPDVR